MMTLVLSAVLITIVAVLTVLTSAVVIAANSSHSDCTNGCNINKGHCESESNNKSNKHISVSQSHMKRTINST